MSQQTTFLTPRRELLGIPNGITGKGVRIVLTDSFFPAHQDLVSKGNRNIQWLDVEGKPFDPAPLTGANPRKGQHGLGRATVCGGMGLGSDGKYGGVAPESEMILLNFGVLDGGLAKPPKAYQYLDFLVEHVQRLGVRAAQFGSVGERTGPLVPWQWDTQRRYSEQITSKGILVVSPTGNCPGSFSPASLAPSALAGGGLELPSEPGTPMRPFHSPEGVSFEGKHLPEYLAPAERVVLPALDPGHDCGIDGVPLGYTVDEGTSFSGPFMVGLLACVWQKHPEITAHQMRTVVQRAARSVESRFGETDVGMPTWQAIEEAIGSAAEAPSAAPTPFETYAETQQLSWDVRMRRCHDTPEGMADVLLNSLPDKAPAAVCSQLASLFRSTSNARARAAIVLLLAPDREDEEPEHPILEEALRDESPLVLGCALDVMRRTPALSAGREEDVVRLLDHSNGQVRYETLLVAEEAPCKTYVRPLIQGMKRDFEQGPMIAFLWRRRCLKAITGETYWPHTRKTMYPGECVYSDYWLAKQRACMERWQNSGYAR